MLTPRPRVVTTDVLVVGGEAAGRRAALEASRRGANVVLVAKAPLDSGGVTMAAVGACAVTTHDPAADSSMVHLEDTIVGGRYLSDQSVVRRFVEDAAPRLLELEEYGVRFDRMPDGELRQTELPGHSHPRSVTVGMRTGQAINAALASVLHSATSVEVLERTNVIELIVDDARVRGAMAIDATGELFEIRAGAVVLATGGIHALFGSRAYPAPDLTGDGLALALRSGAVATDLEFVQFFPTALVWPPEWTNLIWVGELRYSCDAQLLNSADERFMRRHDPERMELSTRDVVARAIALEIREQRGTPHGGVWMTVEHTSPERVDSFVDNVRTWGLFDEAALRADGVDVRRDRLEVAPLVHFHMGGVATDETTATSVRGLFAAGEVAGGLHGANRIENNALTETQVFGAIAGREAAGFAATHPPEHGSASVASGSTAAERPELLAEVQEIVSRELGVLRNGEGLAVAVARLERIRTEAEDRSGPDRPSSIANAALVAEAMARAALARTESRGAHFRLDCVEEDDDRWVRNLVVSLDGRELKVRAEDVAMPYVSVTSRGRRTPPA